jgi:hypothetical protein
MCWEERVGGRTQLLRYGVYIDLQHVFLGEIIEGGEWEFEAYGLLLLCFRWKEVFLGGMGIQTKEDACKT